MNARSRDLVAVFAVVLGTLGLATTMPVGAETATPPAVRLSGNALFDPIFSVTSHPRCLNCHQADAPHQTDTGIRHTQGVVRGADSHGAATLRCQSCHQAKNSADGLVPGTPNWEMAPRTMIWQGLSERALCESMKDPTRNGDRRTGRAVIAHMNEDPLVLWAWNPGAKRSTPPLSHAAFMQALGAWVDAGMPCPGDR